MKLKDTKLLFQTWLEIACFKAVHFGQYYITQKLVYDFKYELQLNRANDDLASGDFEKYPEDDGKIIRYENIDDVVNELVRNERVPVWINISGYKYSKNDTLMRLICAGRFTNDSKELYYYHNGTGCFGIKSPYLPFGYKEGTKFNIGKINSVTPRLFWIKYKIIKDFILSILRKIIKYPYKSICYKSPELLTYFRNEKNKRNHTMGPHYLNRFFAPKTVAIVGASEREESVGYRLLLNMQEAGFKGKLYPVNPKHEELLGLKTYPDIDSIFDTIELVIIATPASTVPDIVLQCGKKGVGAIIIITAGFSEVGDAGKRLQQKVLDIAHRYDIRIIGPNCLGIIRPSGQLNATFGYGTVQDGHLALVSQSGAICTAIIDWAQSQGIGFSTVVSIGSAADIDFGEILDFLAMDSKTTGILLYLEGISDARRFLSGLKAAAGLKHVILIKSGRYELGCKAAMSHTGAMIGGDDVFEAAIERAGVVRAYSISQLFTAARVLANNYVVKQNRLAIITNAGGPGVMSTDRAEYVGVKMAELSESTITVLNQFLPEHWSQGNPVDILGDATPERYKQALDVCLKDDNIDGVLNILTPQAMTNPTQVAQLIIEAAKNSKKPVLASWTGGNRVQEGRDLFASSRVAHFNTPEMGVDAFSFLAKYNQNQKLLKQIPSPNEEEAQPDVDGARLIIERILAEGRQILTTQESKAILAAFRIPVTQTIKVSNAKEAIVAAETMGFPVVLKINMSEFSHKSDIGGVRLNINSVQEVAHHYRDMEKRIKQKHPDIDEVMMTIEPMYRSHNGRELMVGVLRDPVFGPAISFGLGGTNVRQTQWLSILFNWQRGALRKSFPNGVWEREIPHKQLMTS